MSVSPAVGIVLPGDLVTLTVNVDATDAGAAINSVYGQHYGGGFRRQCHCQIAKHPGHFDGR